MKLMKLSTFFVVVAFLTIWSFNLSAQAKTERMETASLVLKSKKGLDTYSFTPLTDFQEGNANQHVGRLQQITASEIKLQYVAGKVEVSFNPEKVKGYDLDNLIRGLIVIHGYSDNYEIKRN